MDEQALSHSSRSQSQTHRCGIPGARTYKFSISREKEVVRAGCNSNAEPGEESNSGSSSHIDETQITPIHRIPVPELPIDVESYVFDAVDVTEIGKQEAEEKHSPDT